MPFCFRAVPLTLLAGSCLLAASPRFVQYPDVRGDKVVFTWDGDLWAGSLAGGAAQRLTSHPGQETHARFSPDGAWIAFSAGYDGGQNVYLMPASGGTPRRLTWRGACKVQGWSPDGRRILFVSAQEARVRPASRLYTVDLEGHEPEVLPILKASYGSFAPDGRVLFSTKGTEEYYWKRYKGGQAPDLWLGDLKTGAFRSLSDYPGRNATGMWYQDAILFLSDRGPKGITNLYRLDPATKAATPLTDYADFDVQWPATDGRTLVYTQAGYLMAMDTAAKRTWKVDLAIASDDWKRRPRVLNPGGWLHSQSLSRDGGTLALEARGDVFLVPVDGKARPRNLTATPGFRERLPVLSPDGASVAYVSDESGAYDLYIRPASGGAAVRIPVGIPGYFSRLAWSPDGRKLLFGDQTFALHMAEVATRKVTRLASSSILQNDQFTWEQADYAWAPDSTWVAYSLQEENRHGRIWLHNTATGQRIPVTDGFHACLNPCFDLDGSRLYFLSHSNMHTVLDPTQDNYILDAPVKLMSLALKAKNEPGAFRVDADGLSERITVLPVKPGNLFHLKAARGLVGYSSLEHWDEPANEQLFAPSSADRWQFRLFDVAKGQETSLVGTVSDTQFSADGSALMVRKGSALHAGPLAEILKTKALPPKVDLAGLSMTVSPVDEWTQVHAETYRLYRDFFYDKDMHGNDWKAIADKFKAWIPECPSRRSLNWLLSQMVGELCVGHTCVGGGDLAPESTPPSPAYPGLLGADYEVAEGHYRFKRIHGPTPYERDLKAPLAGLARAGEFLLAIDGTPLKAPDAIHRLLLVTKGQKVKLTVNARPTLDGARTLEVEPLERENTLRYEAWIADNIALVEKLSGGQLGYIHTTAMGEQNLGQFDKYWGAFRFRKGLVVDVRGNGGGWTEYFMIDKLERQQVGFNVLRGMAPFRYPNTASDGRYVFVSNEENGSDGECFLAHVKARNLGPIVGTRSWGGLVGILNGQSTIDGGSINQPNNAFFGRSGAWWIENEGAVPDIAVENGPDPDGGDRQLRVAVETLLKQLQERPTQAFPPRPPYPKR